MHISLDLIWFHEIHRKYVKENLRKLLQTKENKKEFKREKHAKNVKNKKKKVAFGLGSGWKS